METRAIDIIVPIYNGYEDLLLCVESLRRHTDLSLHRVVLIDDCSPDERVAEYLGQLTGEWKPGSRPAPEETAGGAAGDGAVPDAGDAAGNGAADTACDPAADSTGRGAAPARGKSEKQAGFTAFYNDVNRGFSANVNRGLAWSERDVILLNSDTIVTKGWVDKLQHCAYADRAIATVTPLSNSATLASMPVFCQDNPLPEGFTADSYGELIERVSLHRYPRVTVAVGFCMYVRQEAYLAVGDFDAATFQRGYGEENDFCFRLSQLGYRHVLCDDTFIYHKGTASFDTEEKKRLCEEHERILRERYPELMAANDRYVAQNPDREIRANAELYRPLANGRKNLLYFLHLDFRETAFNRVGGTQLHVADLVRELRGEYNIFVAARDVDCLCLTVYTDRSEKVLRFPIGEEEPYPVFHDRELAAAFRKILTAFSIDAVHVHHTQGLSPDIIEEAAALGIPVVATLHDYYYVCPTVKLLNAEGVFCPLSAAGASGEMAAESGGGSTAAAKAAAENDVAEKTTVEGGEAVKALRVPTMDECRTCLRRTCGYSENANVMEHWRREHARILQLCEKIIFPSESAREIVCTFYPEIREKTLVIPHGTDVPAASDPERQSETADAAGFPAAVQRTSRMHSHLDRWPDGKGGFHYITGWAYLDGVSSEDTQTFAEVTDARGTVHTMRLKKAARPDLVSAAARPDIFWCGVQSLFHIAGMADGDCKIRLVIAHDGQGYTDGRVQRGVCTSLPKGRQMNVAFLGGVTPAKGSRVLREMIRRADNPEEGGPKAGRARANLFVMGQIGDPEVLAMEAQPHESVFFSGNYEREDIGGLFRMSRIHLACILPVWAETFCYTLSEAWQYGIPVIGTDIGAVGERIRETGAGWLLPVDAGADELTALLNHIRQHPEEYREKRARVKALTLRTLPQMAQDYRALYASLSAAAPADGEAANGNAANGNAANGEAANGNAANGNAANGEAADRDFILQGLAAADPTVVGRGSVGELNRLREENRILKEHADMLEQTASYKLARKIAEARVPMKEPLKKLLKKLR